MKVTIEIWKSAVNDEWNCDITTTKDELTSTEYWAVENFCDLLNMVSAKIPTAKCKGEPSNDD
jgi:hypothetical protein